MSNTDRIVVHRFTSEFPPLNAIEFMLDNVTGQIFLQSGHVIHIPRPNGKQERLTRSTLVTIEFAQRTVLHELRFNFSSGAVSLRGHLPSPLAILPHPLIPSRSSITTYYARKHKKKVLNAIYRGAGEVNADIDSLFRQYEKVIAIDTNRGRNSRGEEIAIATAICMKIEGSVGKVASLQAEASIQFQINSPVGNPEIIGIWHFLTLMQTRDPYFFAQPTALITDTEYALVKDWQARAAPLYGDYMLPDGLDVIYATADAGSDEFIPNRLIKACDTLSTQRLRELSSE